jgi:hypothetical protein
MSGISAAGMQRAYNMYSREFTYRPDFLARNIAMREMQAVPAGVESAALAVFFDVTGSMRDIPRNFCLPGGQLQRLITELANRRTIPNPQLMFGAIGDVKFDVCPVQATCFNSVNNPQGLAEAARQLQELGLEGGGGSDFTESYAAAMLFAARKTRTTGRAILFTMGDEMCDEVLSADNITRHLGIPVTEDMTAQQIFAEVKARYEIFHLCFLRNDTYSSAPITEWKERSAVYQQWKDLLGEANVIPVDFANTGIVAEIMVGVIEARFTATSRALIAQSFVRPEVQAAVANAIVNVEALVVHPTMVERGPITVGNGTAVRRVIREGGVVRRIALEAPAAAAPVAALEDGAAGAAADTTTLAAPRPRP